MISGVTNTYIMATVKPRKKRPTKMIQILSGRPPNRSDGPTKKSAIVSKQMPTCYTTLIGIFEPSHPVNGAPKV